MNKINSQPQHRPTKHAVKRTGYFNLSPTWSFKMFDVDHPRWGLNAQSGERLKALLAHLRSREGQTWSKILFALGEHNTMSHPIPASSLADIAQTRLRELNL